MEAARGERRGMGRESGARTTTLRHPRAALHIPALVRGREVGVKPDGTHGSKDKLLCASEPNTDLLLLPQSVQLI